MITLFSKKNFGAATLVQLDAAGACALVNAGDMPVLVTVLVTLPLPVVSGSLVTRGSLVGAFW